MNHPTVQYHLRSNKSKKLNPKLEERNLQYLFEQQLTDNISIQIIRVENIANEKYEAITDAT